MKNKVMEVFSLIIPLTVSPLYPHCILTTSSLYPHHAHCTLTVSSLTLTIPTATPLYPYYPATCLVCCWYSIGLIWSYYWHSVVFSLQKVRLLHFGYHFTGWVDWSIMFIQPSNPLIVDKRDGNYNRFCIDFRKLNQIKFVKVISYT